MKCDLWSMPFVLIIVVQVLLYINHCLITSCGIACSQMLVFIVSEQSGGDTRCGDQVSLAFISDKPILLAACKQKADLLDSLRFGL